MNGPHIDESAELYALGALNEAESAAVDAHAAGCVPCSVRLAQAAAALAALVDATIAPQPAAPELTQRVAAIAKPARNITGDLWPALRILAGLAAALVLGLGFSLLQVTRSNEDLRLASVQDEAAFTALTHSHFLHSQFTKATVGTPDAKVLYARDGAWFYVVIDAPRTGLRVVGMQGTDVRDFGPATTHAHTSTLFVQGTGPMTKLELRAGTTIVGTVTPQY